MPQSADPEGNLSWGLPPSTPNPYAVPADADEAFRNAVLASLAVPRVMCDSNAGRNSTAGYARVSTQMFNSRNRDIPLPRPAPRQLEVDFFGFETAIVASMARTTDRDFADGILAACTDALLSTPAPQASLAAQRALSQSVQTSGNVHVVDSADAGCTCAASQHPPCSFCTSLTAAEVALFDRVGYRRFLAYRRSGREDLEVWLEFMDGYVENLEREYDAACADKAWAAFCRNRCPWGHGGTVCEAPATVSDFCATHAQRIWQPRRRLRLSARNSNQDT